MVIASALSQQTLDKDILNKDKKECKKFGPCGVGKKALYLNSFYIDRMYYVPLKAVKRVYKLVAMSKGGFSGKGVFASMSYLVVEYDTGVEKRCLFKHEEHVDEMLVYIKQQCPSILTVSKTVEQKMEMKAREEALKPKVELTKDAQKAVVSLEKAKDFLEERPALASGLSRAAKAKRVNECANPAYRWVALIIVLMGVVAAVYGVWAVVNKVDFGMYFTLFGMAAVFLFAGANVLPTGRNNKKYIEKQWQNACEDMERYINKYTAFPVPAYYAHPVTLTRMIRVIGEGRAQNAKQALEIVKTDLKALNADVQVEQNEYDEVVTIKPMFLVENYK